MIAALIILAAVTLQRLAELVLSARNTKALLAAGAHEVGAGHYIFFPLLHGGWLVALTAYVIWGGPIVVEWPLIAVFVVLQLGRLWVLLTLKSRWTTRIIVMPGETLVASGPFRFVRHPNYMVVVGEIAVLPLAFGAWPIALIFSLLNGVLLAYRIRMEENALREAA